MSLPSAIGAANDCCKMVSMILDIIETMEVPEGKAQVLLDRAVASLNDSYVCLKEVSALTREKR